MYFPEETNVPSRHPRRNVPLTAFFCLLLFLSTEVTAQQPDAAADDAYGRQAAGLQAQVEESLQRADEYTERRSQYEGMAAGVVERRLHASTLEALRQAQQLAQLVIEQEAAGADPGPFAELARDMLQALPERIRQGNSLALDPAKPGADAGELTATEQIELEAERGRHAEEVLSLYEVLERNIQLSGQLGLDTAVQEQYLSQSLNDAAIGQSVELELAQDTGKVLDRQVKALPDDAELAALARVNARRIERISDTLHRLLTLMEQRGMPVVEYRRQLVASTGAVTADILDYEVLRQLAGNWLQNVKLWTQQNLAGIVFNVLLFLLIVWGSLLLAGLARRLVDRALRKRAQHRLTELARRMIVATAGNLVLILGLLFGLAQLGISIGPLLAGLGIAGFIVGFALQDTLGNFASGMLILLYRPYDVGDFIETNGVLGKVSSMSFVNTTVLTIDNQTLVLPNSKIWGDVLKNVTAQRERRVDMVFGIGYADDIARAEAVLQDIVHKHDKVLDEPEPVIRLHTLNESSVDFVVRPWVRTEDYWEVYWDITRAVKMGFDEQGITIPFPQRDVHLYSADKNAE